MTATMKVTNLQNESSATPNIVLNADGTTTIPTQSTTNLSYTGTLTGGTGVINIGSGQLVKDTAGNLGLGVTPSAWGGTFAKAFQLANGASLVNNDAVDLHLSINSYNNGTNWLYRQTAAASRYEQFNGGHFWFTAPSGTAGNAISFTQAMTLDSDGNLLVGTTTTRNRLTLVGTSAGAPTLGTASGTAFIGGASHQYGILSGVDGTGYGWMQVQRVDGTATAYNLVLQPSGGNLLVGTTSSNGKITSYSTSDWNLACVRTGTSTNGHIQFINGNGQIGSITSNGSTTTYATSSDYRLKENVQPMQNALATVAALKPCTYTWKADGSAGQGFIAHELQAVVSDCVTGEKDAVDAEGNPKYQGVDTSFLVATLTAAIQEQQAIITQLQADVAALKGAA